MGAKGKKLDARPDGSIQWPAFMEKFCADFLEKPAPLDPNADFETNRAAHAGYRFHWQETASRLALLKWHGAEAIEYFLAPLRSMLVAGHADNEMLRIAANIHNERVITLLLEGLGVLEARQTLAKLARLWPLYVLGRLLDMNPTRRQAAAAMLWELLAEFPEWLAPLQEACSPDQAATLARLLEMEAGTDAALEEVPALLRNPPWRNRVAQMELPVLEIANWHRPLQIHWAPEAMADLDYKGDTAAWVEAHAADYRWLNAAPREEIQSWPLLHKALYMLGVDLTALPAIAASGHIKGDNAFTSGDFQSSALLVLPDSLAQQVIRLRGRIIFNNLGYTHSIALYHRLLQRWPDIVVETVCACADQVIYRHLPMLVDMLESDRLAVPLAKIFVRNKWARAVVRSWLIKYPATAARGLMPFVFDPESEGREAARITLRWLAANGFDASLRQEAGRVGQGAEEAMAQLLSVPPEAILPDTLPALPKNLYLPMLPRLILREGGHALPISFLADALMPCMLTRMAEPYVGLTMLQECFTADSLARMGQALFKWWQDNGMAPKDRWMLDIQGFVGNDETARLLTVALRQWRAALARVRAYDAMQILSLIGSDVALMHLNALAGQTRYNDLRERGTAMISELAAQRGLTLDELADRTVPDLGLDASGKLTLDFGPRQFVVEFDNSLNPVLKDADGKRLKTLPAANAKDNALLAKEASATFKDIKKQAKSIASSLARRLEQAMCRQRRWSLEDFTQLFVRHPLVCQYARALVWGSYAADGSLRAAWRIAEDLTLADAADDLYSPLEDLQIGILHRLDATAELIGQFAKVLADYRVLQPFPQLDREIYPLDEAHATGRELPEWVGRKITIASLMGLEQRGWVRAVGDGGMIDAFSRTLSNGSEILLSVLGEWFVGGAPDVKEVMYIARVCARDEDFRFSQISQVEYSEVQRELHLMAWFVD